jgi:DNA-binding NarL/FixJ family response regulator
MAKARNPVDARFIRAHAVPPPSAGELNEREIEVLTLVARGRTSAQIARELKMIKRTVDFHVENAKVKLRAANRTEAATRAVAAHLIEPYRCD